MNISEVFNNKKLLGTVVMFVKVNWLNKLLAWPTLVKTDMDKSPIVMEAGEDLLNPSEYEVFFGINIVIVSSSVHTPRE